LHEQPDFSVQPQCPQRTLRLHRESEFVQSLFEGK
jgi:hypothetical protein